MDTIKTTTPKLRHLQVKNVTNISVSSKNFSQRKSSNKIPKPTEQTILASCSPYLSPRGKGSWMFAGVGMCIRSLCCGSSRFLARKVLSPWKSLWVVLNCRATLLPLMTSEALNQASRPRTSTFTGSPMCTLLTHDRIQSNCSQQPPHSCCGSASLETLQTSALQPLAHWLRLSKKSLYGTFYAFAVTHSKCILNFPILWKSPCLFMGYKVCRVVRRGPDCTLTLSCTFE